MPFSIPEPFVWDESFRTFYERIDDEHKLLFNGIFNMSRDRNSNVFIKDLYRVCELHFAHEEAMMLKSNFADYTPHKTQHEAFLARLRLVSTPVDQEEIDYAKDWLVRHIKGTDFKYKGKI